MMASVQGLLVVATLLAPPPSVRRVARDPVLVCGTALLKVQSDFTEGALALAPLVCRNPERFTVLANELVAATNQRIAAFNERYAGYRCDPDVHLPLPARNTGDVMLALQENLGTIPSDRFCNDVDDPDSSCGNEVEDPGETCDGADLDGQTCESLGNGAGTLGCSPDCQSFDLSGCSGLPYCGNGVPDPGEGCDPGGETPTCDADCTARVCGDAVVNSAAGEECDSGVASATCDADCTTAYCGDGTTNPARGEACDTEVATATCDRDCTPVSCGDGVANAPAGEQCDGGGAATALCDADCTVAYCGDGTTNPARGEACDTGVATATCDGDCSGVQCGDGVVNAPAGEQCDSGGPSALCDPDCTTAYCGDGAVNELRGEECDDENNEDGDGCSAVCRIEP